MKTPQPSATLNLMKQQLKSVKTALTAGIFQLSHIQKTLAANASQLSLGISRVISILVLIGTQVLKVLASIIKASIQILNTLMLGIPENTWRLFFPKSKNGSHPISKLFRKIFEWKKLPQTIGINLIVLILIGLALKFPLYAIGGYHDNSFETIIEELEVSVDPVIETGSTFQDPVEGYISQSFHWYHPGIDIAGNNNNVVRPIASGKVVLIEKSRYGYGKQVIISHGNNIYSRYAHLNMIKVEINQSVTHETSIGYVGNTGFSTGPHLHLEVYKDRKPVNPLQFIPNNYSTAYIDLNQETSAEIASAIQYDSYILGIQSQQESTQSGITTQAVIKQVGEGFEEPFAYTATHSATATPSAFFIENQ